MLSDDDDDDDDDAERFHRTYEQNKNTLLKTEKKEIVTNTNSEKYTY